MRNHRIQSASTTRHTCRDLALGLLAAMVAGNSVNGQTSVRAVALLTVDQVPGVGNTATRFSNTLTGAVVLNNGGAIAFATGYSTTGGGPTGSGIWSDTSGALSALAFQNAVAPGTEGPTAGDTFMGFGATRIVLSDTNRVAFVQQLNGPFSPWGCWQHDGATLQLCALTGQPAPSAPPGLWSLTDTARVNQSNNGLLALRSGFAVGSGTYQSVHRGGPQSMVMCTRNEIAPDTDGLTTIGETLISYRNTTCFSAPYRNVTGGVTRQGIWAGPCAAATNVVSHALLVPSYVGLAPFTVFSSPNAFDFSGTGGSAFTTGLSGTGTTTANDTALWVSDNSGYRLLAREGDQVPGLPAGCFFADLFASLVGPLISGNRHVVFACNITGPGVSSDNARVIVLWEGGTPRVIARTGTQMPGYPAGSNFLSFGSTQGLAINSWGDVVFTGNTFGPPPGRGGQVVYTCPAGGTPEILIESGQPFTVRPGLTVRLSSMSEPLSSGGDDGLPRSWNDRRQYAFKAGWTDVNNFSNSGNGVFTASTGVCTADVGVQGGEIGRDGQLNNNDFVAFITLFFDGDGRADFGKQGGVSGADGAFDNNDFIVFIDEFFLGC